MNEYENAWVMTAQLNEKKDGCELCMRPLVLCKDCKNLGYTNSHWFCKWLNRCVDEDWFCADGRKME